MVQGGIQEAINKLTTWAEDWCVSINMDKFSTTLFTMSTKQKAGKIRIGTTPLKEENQASYLGVIFDKRQTWKPHIVPPEGKARKRLAMMCKLAGTTLGAEEQNTPSCFKNAKLKEVTLKHLYQNS